LPFAHSISRTLISLSNGLFRYFVS
jgi:hypothetical protein